MPAAVSAPATPVVPADDLPAPARDEEQPVMRDGVGVPGVEAVVRAAIAADPSTSPEVLDLFAQDADPSVRVGAAMNPAVRPAILEWLSGDDDAAVRAAVAANERTHAAALARLGCDDDPRVSAAVAANIACPCDVLSELAPGLAYFVLANPNAPSEVLAAGARMPDPVLRAQVARNLATAPSVLGALTGDEDPLVLRSVAENPASPDAVTRRARARLAACGADPAPHIASA
jgi:hypothetical protein